MAADTKKDDIAMANHDTNNADGVTAAKEEEKVAEATGAGEEGGKEEEIGEDAENEDEDEEDDDPFLKFQNVMTAINFEHLKKYAIEVRLQQRHPEDVDLAGLTCEVIEPPLHGSFNLVYVLKFGDGVKWVTRFPIQGTRVEDADCDKMNTDYSTMRYIRKKHEVPTPEIYTWETTCGRVGVPFAFMSFAEGTSVRDRWIDKDWITEEKKLTILGNLARIMAKLSEPKFDKIGTLRFSDENTVSHIGPDHQTLEDEDTYYEEGTVYVNLVGPYKSLIEWLAIEDTYEDLPEAGQIKKGCMEVMKLALQSVPSYLRRSNRCEIDFFDYNYQNILIDDNCNITAIYDWDGIRAAPQGIGCTRYPSWITRDWDPGQYETPEDGDWAATDEDSPQQLSRYRKHYADTFASLNPKDYDPRQTRLSHILEAVSIGMGERFSRQYIMISLLNHAYGEGKWPGEYREIIGTLMDPTTAAAKAMRKKMLKQFKGMWHAEWETLDAVEKKKQSIGPRRYMARRRSQKHDIAATDLVVTKKPERSQSYGRSISQYLSTKLAKLKR